MGTSDDNVANELKHNPIIRAFSIVALLLGGGTGVFTVQVAKDVDEKTADRYTSTQAIADFKLRDLVSIHNAENVAGNKAEIEKIKDSHPPRELVGQIASLALRVRDLELSNAARNGKGG